MPNFAIRYNIIYAIIILCCYQRNLMNCLNYQNMNEQFQSFKVQSIQKTLNKISQTHLQQAKLVKDNQDKTQDNNQEHKFITFLNNKMKQQFKIQMSNFQHQDLQFERNYQNFINLWSLSNPAPKVWKGNVQLNSIFKFKNQVNNQSFLIKGYQLSKLALQVTVRHLDTLASNNQGILIVVVDLSIINSQFGLLTADQQKSQDKLKKLIIDNAQHKIHVRKNHFITIDLVSAIYEIFVFRENQLSQIKSFPTQQINLLMSVERDLKQYKNNIISAVQEEQIVQNMKSIVKQNEQVFFDSLQIWEQIQTHRKQHEQTVALGNKIQTYQSAGLILLYTLQFAALRYLLGSNNVI